MENDLSEVKTLRYSLFSENHEKLRFLSKKQRWGEMSDHIDDEILNEYACVGLHREIVDIVKKKYKNIVTHVEFSIPFERGEDRHLRSMLQELKGDWRIKR